LRKHQLHNKCKKHEFWLEEVLLLGHVISKEMIKIDLQKEKTIIECPKPTNVTETRNIFGLVGYYRALGNIFQRQNLP